MTGSKMPLDNSSAISNMLAGFWWGDKVDGKSAIISELIGTAHVIAESVIHISDRNPLAHGFIVGDMWSGRIPS